MRKFAYNFIINLMTFRVGIWSIMEDGGLSMKAKMSHNQELTCLILSQNGRHLLTGSLDESVKVWEADGGFLTQVMHILLMQFYSLINWRLR